jgi:hypothetical protein
MTALPHDDGMIVEEVVVEVLVTEEELVAGTCVVEVLVLGTEIVELVVAGGTVVVGGGGHGLSLGRGTQTSRSLSRSFGFPVEGMPVRSILSDPGFFLPFFDCTAIVTLVAEPHWAPLRLAGGGMVTPFA